MACEGERNTHEQERLQGVLGFREDTQHSFTSCHQMCGEHFNVNFWKLACGPLFFFKKRGLPKVYKGDVLFKELLTIMIMDR